MKNQLIRETVSPDTVSDAGASVFFDLQGTEGIDNHVLSGQVFPVGSVEFDRALSLHQRLRGIRFFGSLPLECCCGFGYS
jgi:hypothetical protein